MPSGGVHGKVGGRLIRRTAVVRTRMPGGVGGAAPRGVPLSRSTVLTLTRIIHEAGKQRHRIVENQLVSGEVKSGAEANFRLDHDCSENF